MEQTWLGIDIYSFQGSYVHFLYNFPSPRWYVKWFMSERCLYSGFPCRSLHAASRLDSTLSVVLLLYSSSSCLPSLRPGPRRQNLSRGATPGKKVFITLFFFPCLRKHYKLGCLTIIRLETRLTVSWNHRFIRVWEEKDCARTLLIFHWFKCCMVASHGGESLGGIMSGMGRGGIEQLLENFTMREGSKLKPPLLFELRLRIIKQPDEQFSTAVE